MDEYLAVWAKYSEQSVELMQRNISGWPPLKDMSEDEALKAILNEIHEQVDNLASLGTGELSASRRLGAWARVKPFVMDLLMSWKSTLVVAAAVEDVDMPTLCYTTR